MKIPIELLADGMNEDRILVFRKLVDPLRPERDGETDEEDCFNQNDRKLEMGGNSALHALVVGDGMAASAKTKQHVNKERRPAHKERPHEPMRELDDVIDLVAMLGSI